MKEDFSELIEYLDKEFGEVKVDVKDLKENFDLLSKSVDDYAVKSDKYFQEMVMHSHQLNRHEKWLLQIAEKLGIKLEF
jgi:hypothetical protein